MSAPDPGKSGSSRDFEIVSEFTPTGDQPQAIASLVDTLRSGQKFATLLGATGRSLRRRGIYTTLHPFRGD